MSEPRISASRTAAAFLGIAALMSVLIIWAQRVDNAPDRRPSATPTPGRATEAQEAQDLRRLMDREQRFTDCLAFSAACCDCRRQAASFTGWMRGGRDGQVHRKPECHNPEHRPIVIDERTEDWEIVGLVGGAMIGPPRQGLAEP